MRVSEPQVRKDSRLFEELCAALLRRGKAVQFRVNGQSMSPNLLDGDDVVVVPASAAELRRGDVVLAKNADGLRVHRVDSLESSSGNITLRSDTGLESDPPASRVFGKVVSRRRGLHEQPFTGLKTRFLHPLRILARRTRLAAWNRLCRASAYLISLVTFLFFCAALLAPAVHAQTADLQLTQTAVSFGTTTPVTAVAAGTTYSYTEVVTNNTSSAAVTTGTITAYMQTPPNTTYQSYAGTNWTCTNPGAGGIGPIVCTYNAALASGGTASTVTISFQVAAGTTAGTTILNSATVTNSTFVDPVPSNNTNITSIIVEPTTTSDMALSMSVAPTPVFISSNLTYTIQVQNLGQLTAPVTSNVLTDTLPAGVSVVSIVTSPGWSCSGSRTCFLLSYLCHGHGRDVAPSLSP